MKRQTLKKNIIEIGVFCLAAMMITSVPVFADEKENLQNQSSSLQENLNGINEELETMSQDIADVEMQIEQASNDIISTEEQIAIIENTRADQYEDMKYRIQYLYEGGSSSFMEILASSRDMADFLNKAEFVESVGQYDRDKLDELQETQNTIEEQNKSLNKKKSSLETMKEDLKTKREDLTAKAEATSTSIEDVNNRIAQIKADEEAKAAQEAKAVQEAKAAQEAQAAKEAQATKEAQAAQPEKESQSVQASAGGSTSGTTNQTPSAGGGESSSNGPYTIPPGGLTPSKGVVYFNGHRETYYSQRVLPGNGLRIPGRHVAPDGTIRDEDNYICVASSDLPRGTIVETSLGTGKVYDSGCASGTIDIYTDW